MNVKIRWDMAPYPCFFRWFVNQFLILNGSQLIVRAMASIACASGSLSPANDPCSVRCCATENLKRFGFDPFSPAAAAVAAAASVAAEPCNVGGAVDDCMA